MNAVRDKVMKVMTTEELNHLVDTDGKFELRNLVGDR